MAQPLKFVLLGNSLEDVEALVGELASHFGEASIEQGLVAGCAIFRFSGKKIEEEAAKPFILFGVSMQSDFRGLYKLLLSDADGVIALIPAVLGLIEDSRQVLSPLFRSLQAHREQENDLPFLIQYYWKANASDPPPEVLDAILGVNPESVTRVFTQAGSANQADGLNVLFAKQEQKSLLESKE